MLANFLKTIGTIIDSFSYTQWLKIICIITVAGSTVGFSDTIKTYIKNYVTTNKDNGSNISKVELNNVPVIPNILPASITDNINKEINKSNKTNTKVKVKINIEYEVTTASNSNRQEELKSVSRPVVMMAAPPPPPMTILGLTNGRTGLGVLRIVGMPAADPNKVSFNRINYLWDIYCSDPDFSIQCESNNHD